MADILYPKESYEIIGAAIKVFNELGFGYQEKYYYRAFENVLHELKFNVSKQLWTPLVVGGRPIGGYYLDFLIEKNGARIVVELKVADAIYPQHIKQVYGYLRAHNIKLGIIIVISKNGIIQKRLAN